MTPENPHGETEAGVTIQYSVKELIEGLHRKLDSLMTLLHGKADSVTVKALEVRMDRVEEHIATQTHHRELEEKRADWRRWLIPTLATLILAAATVASLLKT
ncbi:MULTISPECIES: hypothetical protein [Streptomycetaceae]|uniref:Uncharacterized protein n=1 Tax=Streptantibioticus cattleyicolor (strain ATCC 35852 / DSM 46488 / JCM 4925 / NBRC 14057 / NRRL 8057) TaxID=1003195 RepID=F8JS11_STREN|nr:MULTISPECIES: hypothetical protein [Streptomycetaceae]AEW92919.1 hypothetical protein SCATT_05480 [Streptantibioticus cattleyicolor NRRL 8057 = DSM 46488]MYS57669.1 hypothetical protein [Streptomyces sp. SID5468]CCB73280.1 protein of unknown function [Streptantibioticus cattleyicolor NRRL 8057 = DSM 46488]